MHIHIDAQNGLPIYEQVVRQVQFAIANGVLRPGEHVPSIRELAQQLAINPNTVIRAYRDLQTAGILATVRGTGLAITAEAPARCRADRLQNITQRLQQVLGEARQSLLPVAKVRAIIEAELKQWPPDPEK